MATLRQGLSRTRSSAGLFGRLKALLGAEPRLDPQLAEQIEELLLTSDVGARTTERLMETLRSQLASGQLRTTTDIWNSLRREALSMLSAPGHAAGLDLGNKPSVLLFVGVNGVGKTTTIGKLARQLQADGRKCVLAAGDTFRAAAVQQLKIWGQRVGCDVFHGKDGADPASVIFDATKSAVGTDVDVVLADTAGRLHTKSNLMAEMQKIARSADRAMPGAPHEILLVIDATNGQNAIAQAREFQQTLQLTGVVLTKLDGTAKGGMVLGIADTLGLPVRYVGMGERPEDLHRFDAERFVDALLGEEPVAAE